MIRQLNHHRLRTEGEDLEERELDAFGDLAVTTNFIQSLAASVQLPSVNQKTSQEYVSGLRALRAEIDPLKPELGWSNFVIPMENLEEPGMAEGALKTLDQFKIEKTGAELGFLYQNLNKSCLSQLQKHCEQQKETSAQIELEAPIPEPPSQSTEIEQQEEDTKSRPPHSSVYSIAPTKEESLEPEATTPTPVFKVKLTTFDVFTTPFTPSESRSIKWTAFEAAMAGLRTFP